MKAVVPKKPYYTAALLSFILVSTQAKNLFGSEHDHKVDEEKEA